MLYNNVLDIETYIKDEKLIPYCICIILKNERIILYKESKEENLIERLIEELRKRRTKETIYVHNLTFDGVIIIENIKKETNVKFKAMVFKGSIYELEIWDSDFKIKMKCSYKLMPMSLKKIGKILKKEYEKLEFPHEFINEENFRGYIGEHPLNKEIKKWNLKEECIKYCIRDCEIVEEMLKRIFDDKKLRKDIKGRSISGLALEVFKKDFNKEKIETKLRKDEDELIRKGYFGGRCEVFGNNKEDEKIFHFDFTGMYSSVMEEEFCFGKIKIKKDPKEDKIEEWGFYEVTVESKEMHIPILPVKSDDGKLIFPNGTWRGTYWYEELKLFEEEGGIIKKIHNKITFERKGKPFTEFIKYFRKMRKKSEFDDVFWKLFLNSIYGRMGMNESKEKTKIIQKAEYSKYKNKKITKEIIISDAIIISYEEEEKKDEINSNVAIAAAITSKARIKLFKAYKSVIEKEGRILYSDTDSIFAGFKRDVANEEHGEVFWDTKKKNTIIDKAIFAIPKGYATISENTTTVKIKGFTKNSISFEEFEECFKSKKEMIKEESYLQKANFIFRFEKIEKTILLHNYSKRIFSEDKKETKALTIEEKSNE